MANKNPEWYNSKLYKSPIATAIKIFDPTGVSSYGDVLSAWNDGKFDYQDILEPVGAIPVVGKFGKLAKYLGKGIKGLNDLEDARKVMRTVKKVSIEDLDGSTKILKRSNKYTKRQVKAASTILNNNKTLNAAQYSTKVAAGIDDIIDTGNQLTAFTSSPPQYGLGSWLGENAGAIGTVVGAGLGTLIAPGIGTQLGASLGGSVGGAIQSNVTQDAANAEALKNQQLQMSRQNALTNLQNQNLPQYGAQFALGGYVPKIEPWMFSNVNGKLNYAGGGSLNFKSPAAYKAWLGYVHATGLAESTPGNQKVSIKGQPHKVQHADGGMLNSFKCGGKMYAGGGMMETTAGADGMTYYANGGTHENNPLGGVPVGNRGLVEQGEFRFGDYIFSNRF